MRNVRVWLFGALVLVALAGLVLLVGAPSSAASADPVLKDHWRHHDGHWSYYYEPDKMWYYTDGTNWYYNDDDAWKIYRFDRKFGREGFERGEYKIPGEDVKIVVPSFHVYRPG
jgi:hypothetical protein